MPRGYISLYPAFYDGQDNSIILVNEDSVENEPDCLKYSLDEAGIDQVELGNASMPKNA